MRKGLSQEILYICYNIKTLKSIFRERKMQPNQVSSPVGPPKAPTLISFSCPAVISMQVSPSH